MIHCDLCGGWIKEKDFKEENVSREHNFIACDICMITWDETRMMFYDVLYEEEE